LDIGQKVRSNYRNFRTHLHRAVVRPDPYGIPGWIIDSDQLALALVDTFGKDFRSMIDMAFEHNVEMGVFICYDIDEDSLKLGPVCFGRQQLVIIKDCIGYRPVGSFHVHLGLFRKVAFSPPDIQGGLHEFVLAVAGNIRDSISYEMAILSPYNYWKLADPARDAVDYHLNAATSDILLANVFYREQPEGWQINVSELDKKANAHMEEVFRMLKMVYAQL